MAKENAAKFARGILEECSEVLGWDIAFLEFGMGLNKCSQIEDMLTQMAKETGKTTPPVIDPDKGFGFF